MPTVGFIDQPASLTSTYSGQRKIASVYFPEPADSYLQCKLDCSFSRFVLVFAFISFQSFIQSNSGRLYAIQTATCIPSSVVKEPGCSPQSVWWPQQFFFFISFSIFAFVGKNNFGYILCNSGNYLYSSTELVAFRYLFHHEVCLRQFFNRLLQIIVKRKSFRLCFYTVISDCQTKVDVWCCRYSMEIQRRFDKNLSSR